MRSQYFDTVTRRNGSGLLEPLGNVRVTVTERGGGDPVVLFTGPSGGTTKSNPFTTDVDGIATFYVDNGTAIDVVYHDLNGTSRIADYTIRPVFPAEAGGIPQSAVASGGILPAGVVLPYAGQSPPPAGYLLCDGSAVSRSTFDSLFSVVGTQYGAGNGSTTFNVPDFRSRVLLGAGQGPGLTDRDPGSTGGEETHDLSIAETPAHAHGITDPGHDHDQLMRDAAGTSSSAPARGQTAATGTVLSGSIHESTTGIANTDSAGGGDPHNNMPPYAVAHYIIKT